jgi:hypothetical protein
MHVNPTFLSPYIWNILHKLKHVHTCLQMVHPSSQLIVTNTMDQSTSRQANDGWTSQEIQNLSESNMCITSLRRMRQWIPFIARLIQFMLLYPF